MTPEQLGALEGLVGRKLTSDEITTLSEPLMLRNDVAMAALLSAGRTQLGTVSRADFAGWAATFGMRSKIQDFSTTVGHPLRDSSLAILDVLIGAASGIDMSKAANQAIVAAWVAAGVLSTEHKDILMALASQPDPISVSAVSDALNIAEGRMTL